MSAQYARRCVRKHGAHCERLLRLADAAHEGSAYRRCCIDLAAWHSARAFEWARASA